MATATHYDAFDFLEHVVNRALQPRNHAAASACNPARQAAAQPQERQETRLIRMNVTETDTAYWVAAELPGVAKEDVDVVIEGKDVSLQASSKRPVLAAQEVSPNGTPEGSQDGAQGAPERLLMGERFYGKLSRRIQLPQEIDETAAEARFVDGILHLQLPKKKVAVVKKLEIR
jgi:HSP20 family protein